MLTELHGRSRSRKEPVIWKKVSGGAERKDSRGDINIRKEGTEVGHSSTPDAVTTS